MRSMRELFGTGSSRGEQVQAPPASDALDAAPVPTAAPVAQQQAPTGSVPPIRRPPTVAGPCWEATISAEEPFGAWVEVPIAGTGAIQMTWSEGPQPVLSLADQVGNWVLPEEQPDPPLHTAWLQLRAGWTWVAVEAPYAASQAIRVAVWLPAAASTDTPTAA